MILVLQKDTPGIESDVLDSIEQANQNPDTFHKPDPSLDDVGLNLIQNRVDNKDHSQEHKKGDDGWYCVSLYVIEKNGL